MWTKLLGVLVAISCGTVTVGALHDNFFVGDPMEDGLAAHPFDAFRSPRTSHDL